MATCVSSDGASSNSSSLLSLPNETFNQVISRLPHIDQISLAQTCRALRFSDFMDRHLFVEPISRTDFPITRKQAWDVEARRKKYKHKQEGTLIHGFAAELHDEKWVAFFPSA